MICKKCKMEIEDNSVYCSYCGKRQLPEERKVVRRANGTGTVYRLSGRRRSPWVAAKNKKIIGYFEKRSEALLALSKTQGKSLPEMFNSTVFDILQRWQGTNRYKRLSEDTKASYRAAWKYLEPQGDKKIRDMKTSHFQSAINSAVEEGKERDTCEKIRSLCSLICQEAMKDDIIDRNYSLGLELPRKQEKNKRNFSEEDIIKLFDADNDRDARIVLCLIYTGMRIGEFFDTLKVNVFPEERYLIAGNKTEAGKNRVIPIREEILPYIYDFMEEGTGKYLVCNSKGNRIDRCNYLKRNFYPLLDRLHIIYKDEQGNTILTPHRSRHTFISEAIEGKIAPEALIKIVGHSKYTTSVEKYNDVVDLEYLKKEAAKGL